MKWKHVHEQSFGFLSLFSVLVLGLGSQVTSRVWVTASEREQSCVFQVRTHAQLVFGILRPILCSGLVLGLVLQHHKGNF